MVNGDGQLLGRLPPFAVETPWWQDLEPIVEQHPELVVLRLLAAQAREGQPQHGGRASYLVEARRAPRQLIGLGSSDNWVPGEAELEGLLADHPLRMSWARPGGPASDLSWAGDHVRVVGRPRQIRSWNLSSIWALPTADGTAWLKCVPPFFGHEAATISTLGPSDCLPRVIAADGARLLMEEMPGRDGYGAGPDEYAEVISALLVLQSALVTDRRPLHEVVPSWSAPSMAEAATKLLDDASRPLEATIGAGPMGVLHQLLDRWDERWEEVNNCGIPDTVFHGDLHPGNARIGSGRPVLFDWGDSGWGHPLLDLGVVSAYHHDDDLVARTLHHWLEGWRRLVPGSDPARAWELLRPVARLRTALVFENFLTNIEPSERVYHEADLPTALARAAATAVDGGGPS